MVMFREGGFQSVMFDKVFFNHRKWWLYIHLTEKMITLLGMPYAPYCMDGNINYTKSITIRIYSCYYVCIATHACDVFIEEHSFCVNIAIQCVM